MAAIIYRLPGRWTRPGSTESRITHAQYRMRAAGHGAGLLVEQCKEKSCVMGSLAIIQHRLLELSALSGTERPVEVVCCASKAL